MNDYGAELLADALRLAGEKEPEQTASRLFALFGGFSAVIDAQPQVLRAEGELSENAAVLLKLLPEITRRRLCEHHKMPRKITDPGLYDALTARCFGLTRELLIVIAADKNDRITEIWESSQDRAASVSLDLDRVMEFAYRVRAAKLVLAHNHPEGFAVPSASDTVAQRIIGEVAAQTDIELYDHIIIADDGCVSVRQSFDR